MFTGVVPVAAVVPEDSGESAACRVGPLGASLSSVGSRAFEELAALVVECRSLSSLVEAEPVIESGLHRLGRALMEETVRAHAAAAPEPEPGTVFSPSGRLGPPVVARADRAGL